jgi:diacylglycerol kinase (ATP)
VRAAAIFGLGTSPADLKPFQSDAKTEWQQGLPASSGDADAILIFGGDGTIHRHLAALVRLQLPALIVPTGSGNDFARALNLRSIQDSLRVWQDFTSGRIQTRKIDLGVITPTSPPEEPSRYFCTVAGCGLDSAAAGCANAMPRWLRAHGGYALAILPLLLKLPACTTTLTEKNGSPITHNNPTLLTAFANTQYYGDGMRIAPQADFTDGKLDICRISAMNPLQLLRMFPTVYFGHHLRSPKVAYSTTERVILETDPPLEIYADGEFVCHTPAEMSVAVGALNVIMPT